MSSLPTPRLNVTAVASLGVAPTNHDDETCWSASFLPAVAVPVLPIVGQMVRPLVPVPTDVTFCSAATVSPATSSGIERRVSRFGSSRSLPPEPVTFFRTCHWARSPPAAMVA